MDDKPHRHGLAVEGPATDKYRPSNVAPPTDEELRHEAGEGRILVEETSGVAAAEATGKIDTDNEADPFETAGSG